MPLQHALELEPVQVPQLDRLVAARRREQPAVRREQALEHVRVGMRVELRAVPYKATSGWSAKAPEAELKGVEGGD